MKHLKKDVCLLQGLYLLLFTQQNVMIFLYFFFAYDYKCLAQDDFYRVCLPMDTYQLLMFDLTAPHNVSGRKHLLCWMY